MRLLSHVQGRPVSSTGRPFSLGKRVINRQGCPRRSVDCQPQTGEYFGEQAGTTVKSRGMFPGFHSEIDDSWWELPMLTEIQCRNATCPPDKKRLRLTDAGGLYLEVSPTGSKRWFWKTYADGKEGRLALGRYPEVTLKAVRLARDAAKRDRAAGIDLVQVRKLAKLKRVVAEGEKPSRRRRWSGTAGTKRAGAATTPFARSATSKKTCSPTSPSGASAKSRPSNCWPRCVAWRSAVRWT